MPHNENELLQEQSSPPEFILHRKYQNGGEVFINRRVIERQEFSKELEMAEMAAGIFGWKIYLLPELAENDPLRSVLLPDARRGTANPDYLIDGIYGDHKQTTVPTTAKNLEHRIEEKLRQGDIILLKLSDIPDDALIKGVIERRMTAKPRLKKVLVVKADGTFKLYQQKSQS